MVRRQWRMGSLLAILLKCSLTVFSFCSRNLFSVFGMKELVAAPLKSAP